MKNVFLFCRYGKNVTASTVTDDYDSSTDVGLNILKLLISDGGDAGCRDDYNLTPLHHAAMRGNIKIVEHLVTEPGVKIAATDTMGSTPLHIAATYKNLEVVKILLSHDAGSLKMKDKQLQTPLHRAAQEGCAEILEVIMETIGEKEEDILEEDSDGSTPFTLAVEDGNCEAVR